MINNEYHFSIDEIENNCEILKQHKITQLLINDEKLFNNKNRLLSFISKVEKSASEIIFIFYINPIIIDKDIIQALSHIYSQLQIIITPELLQSQKKQFIKKIALLNDFGLIFGFDVDCSMFATIKTFKQMLDEIILFYPNHIDIQTESLVPTDKLSTQDIKTIQDLSYSQEVFYSEGRAVPWFLAVLQSLRIKSVQFFSDFAEWQKCNNCSKHSKFNLDNTQHIEIERMQLNFLKIKYEEKSLQQVFSAVKDLISLHGAFSRADSNNQSTELSLSYNPDDILSPYAMDLLTFVEEVCIENLKVIVYPSDDGPQIKLV